MTACPEPREYAVFLSYRHEDNQQTGRQWASWLHHALETYEVPPDLIGTPNNRGEPIPASLYPVFRDEEELAADADLGRNIRTALEHSRLLVVLCSPRAAVSRFVAEEIRVFKELGKGDRILALLIDGEPNASDNPAKQIAGISPALECLPEPLRFGRLRDNAGAGEKIVDWTQRAEPIAADVRPQGHPEQGWTTTAAYRDALGSDLPRAERERRVAAYDERLRLAIAKIVAGALAVPLGELTRRDKAYQLRRAQTRTRTFRRIALGFAVLAMLASLVGVFAWQQRRLALANEGRAESNARVAQEREEKAQHALSMSDYFRADTLVAEGKRPEALAYLARAIRADPDHLAAGQRALLLLQQGLWYLPEKLPSMGDFAPVAATFSTGNELRILGVKEDRRGNEIIARELTIFGEDGKALFAPLSLPQIAGNTFFEAQFADGGRLFTADSKYWSTETGSPASAPESDETTKSRMKQIARQFNLVVRNFRDELVAPNKIALSPSGRFVAALVDGPQLALCDTKSGKVVRQQISEVIAIDLSFSPDETKIVVAHDDTGEFSTGVGSAEIIPFEVTSDGNLSFTQYQIARIPQKTSRVDWLPDGAHFVRNTAFVCDTRGTTISALLPQNDRWTQDDLFISPDSLQIVGGGIWRRIGVPPFPCRRGDTSDGPAIAKCFSNGDSSLSSGDFVKAPSGNYQLRLLSGEAVELLGSGAFSYFEFSSDQSIVLGFPAYGEKPARCAVWDGHSGQKIGDYPQPEFKRLLAISSDLAIAYAEPNRLVIWDVRTGRLTGTPLSTELSNRRGLLQAAIHPDGHRLFVNEEGHLEVWDLGDFKLVGKADLEPSHNVSVGMTFSPNGTFFTTVHQFAESEEHFERIWDVQTYLPVSDNFYGNELFGGRANGDVMFTENVAADGHVYFRARVGLALDENAESVQEKSEYLRFLIPETGPLPVWLADLLEAVGGLRLSKEAISEIPAEDRRRVVAEIRSALNRGPTHDPWASFAGWWLDDGPDRKVAAGSSVRVFDIVEKRLASDSIPLLKATALAVPEDPRIFTRLAALLRQGANPNPLAADANARRAQRLHGTPEVPPTPTALQPLPFRPSPAVTPSALPQASPEEANLLFAHAEELRQSSGALRNSVEAFDCYRRAAALGHTAAKHRLGVCYATGFGVSKSEEQAVAWYRRAAEEGFAEAQYDLGVRYLLGRGIAKDEQAGLEWYRKAASQGYTEAIDALRKRVPSR